VDDTVSGPHSPLTLSWLMVSARLIPGMFVLWLMLLGFVQKSCGGENRNLGMRYPLASRFKKPFWRGEMGRTKEISQWVTGAVDLSVSDGSTLVSSNVCFQ
jgi:hypothetical protein